ncbi:MAG: TIGR03960 family B12-binding radical SAM protein [candidate division WOR-3 bacterium]
MFEQISEVLPLVTKPIRYTGGEYNSFSRDPEPGQVTWVLSMPEVYEIGASNYGLKILYSILNRLPNTVCERCYLPWPDFGSALLSRGIPLYTLESKRPVRQFNILGVSLQSELSYTNLLYLLEVCSISLYRQERTIDDPLVVAGGPCTVNPLPLTDFVDVFVIGDGEEVVQEITAVYANWNHLHRDELLKEIARLKGVYVPGYSDSQTPVVRRFIAQLREEDFPFPPLVPICEITHDRLTVEIARGCTRGCRFCQAGMINRPMRFRDVEQVVRLAERGIRASGWEEVSLLSLSALDYPYLSELIERLNSRLRERRVAISLPSTRGEDFSLELAFNLQEVKKAGLTFAPETIAPRLRRYINKNISEEKIIHSVQNALDAGWAGVKLYFIIGLPGENTNDVMEIGRFVNEIARLCRHRMVRVNLTPFIPKPHTPLQWEGFADLSDIKEKMDLLKRMFVRKNIKPKWESPESAWVQAILARGDNKIAKVIEQVYRAGGVFQGWSEFFKFYIWQEAFAKTGVDPKSYLRVIPVEEKLPWDFIDVGVTKEFLKEEYLRAGKGEKTPDCLHSSCTNCGVCAEKHLTIPSPPAKLELASAADYRGREFSRYNELKNRFRLKYCVEEPFRFAGHLDRVRAFYRALRRSELPIVWTKGFAPKPMLSFGPPLPVGVLSEGEYLDIYLTYSYSGNIVRDLGPFLPKGLRFVAARLIPNSSSSLGELINLGRYEIQHQKHKIQNSTEVLGVRRLIQEKEGVLLLDLAIAPGIKLFNTLAQLFGITNADARRLLVKRKDCLVENNGLVRSPFGEPVT